MVAPATVIRSRYTSASECNGCAGSSASTTKLVSRTSSPGTAMFGSSMDQTPRGNAGGAISAQAYERTSRTTFTRVGDTMREVARRIAWRRLTPCVIVAGWRRASFSFSERGFTAIELMTGSYLPTVCLCSIYSSQLTNGTGLVCARVRASGPYRYRSLIVINQGYRHGWG